MNYTVKEIGELAKVSSRTIRYYDKIDLLKPAKINSSGYRIYNDKQVNRLQHILFFKELGLKLSDIKDILNSSEFDEIKILEDHLDKLLEEKDRIDLLINNIKNTIEAKKEGKAMVNKDKFEGFKKKMIEDNEKKYGKEIRDKFGDEKIDKSYSKLEDMNKQEYENLQELEQKLNETLLKAMKTGKTDSKLAKETVDLHCNWISFYWDEYSKEAHIGLANMYVEDERFKSYYDKIKPGAAEFLRDSIINYLKN